MKSPKELIRFLSERVLAKQPLNQDGRNYYRKHAKQLKQDLRVCPKFHLGKLDDWDFDADTLGIPEGFEIDLRLPYDSMLIEFEVNQALPAGVLLRQRGDTITGECYVGAVKAMFVHTFTLGESILHKHRLNKSRVKNVSPAEYEALVAGDQQKHMDALEKSQAANERELIGITLTMSAMWAILFMNEGALAEDSGDIRAPMDASREDREEVVYKTLVIDLDKAKKISVSRGGTHASPRHHTRRGHWRHLASGKKVWIGPMEVGDKENGEVVKEYKVKSTGLWDRLVDKMNQYTAFARR